MAEKKSLIKRGIRKANRVARRTGRRLTGRKMLTVVIPLYNAMPYFKKTVESILGQTYDLSDVEVLIMDDGSTDGSVEYAEEVAAKHPGLFRVVRCGRNGGPSVPRNMGIDQAKGKYIFFCDADDYFEIPEAFQRMLSKAEAWKSDVVLVKVSSPDGRDIPRAAFREGDKPTVDIHESDAFGTMGPWKLYRTRLLRENGIRFPEEVKLREDELFTSRAYLAAKTVSIAANSTYYALTARDDQGNLYETARPVFEKDFFVLTHFLDILNTKSDMSRADKKMLPRVFRSSWMACAKAIAQMEDDQERQQAFDALRSTTTPYFGRSFVQSLPSSMQLLFRALENEDILFFVGLADAIELTPNGSFLRYRVLEEEVREEGEAVFWSQSFSGHSYEIEVAPKKVVCQPIDGMPFPGLDTSSPEHIPFDAYDTALLKAAVRPHFVQRAVQNAILENIAPYLKHYVGHEERCNALDPVIAGAIRAHMEATMAQMSPQAILSLDGKTMGFDHKVALLTHYLQQKPSFQKVYVRRVDLKRKTLRLQAFGEMPKVLLNGQLIEPLSKKLSVRMFLGQPLVRSYEFLVSYEEECDRLTFSYDEEIPITVNVNGRAFENSSAIRELTDEFTKGWNRYAQKGDVWIVMDRDTGADDNGEHFYRYLMNEHPDQECLFALRSSSPDWGRLEAEGFRLIDFGTPEYERQLKACSTIVSSHIDKYVSSYFDDRYLLSKRIIFLQHGVIKDDLSSWLNTKPEMDLMVTSTQAEYDSIVRDGSPYRLLPEEVILSGLPRHDALLRKDRQRQGVGSSAKGLVGKTLLIMPTWRNNLVGEVIGTGNERTLNPSFAQSDYARAWGSFLQSPFLKNLVEQGMEVIFFPHANMAPYVSAGQFAIPDYIVCASNGDKASIQDFFLGADLFVTDYSSAVFDEALLDRPCFYYQFDSDGGIPRGYHFAKGYFDYQKDGFGPVASTQEQLEESIRRCVENGFEVPAIYEERSMATLAFRDGENCGRVYEAIKSLC